MKDKSKNKIMSKYGILLTCLQSNQLQKPYVLKPQIAKSKSRTYSS